MKPQSILLSAMFVVQSLWCNAQLTSFSNDDAINYVKQHDGMTFDEISSEYPMPDSYYKNSSVVNLYKYAYFDSLLLKYGLTNDETKLISKNGFMVTERLSYSTFVDAYRDIFHKDMPVFISTDALLFSLHASYDNIMKKIEANIMEQNLKTALLNMYVFFPNLKEKYKAYPQMQSSLKDIDLYVTIALSLLDQFEGIEPHPNPAHDLTLNDTIDVIFKDIKDRKYHEDYTLFGINRAVDFSQFIPRGHYVEPMSELNDKTLKNYFETMMWLGRIDFLLTSPDLNTYPKSDFLRSNIDALLMNELMETSGAKKYIDENDKIITFWINQCDNVTPSMIDSLQKSMKLPNAASLLDNKVYDTWYFKVDSNPNFDQQICSDMYNSDTLPVSYRLLGQRYIVDSYTFSQVTNSKAHLRNNVDSQRLMPKTMDALFTLGNNNALSVLKTEIEKYDYAHYLSASRKSIDGYDSIFWNQSQYNIWLNSIRDLNPTKNVNLPFFMTTAGWQHEKMNTQLASWAQIRHDNLLYAKQSYSGSGCSFPYSYVEPYPQLYAHIKQFAKKSEAFFTENISNIYINDIPKYYNRVAGIMDTLENISQAELEQKCLMPEEIEFLKKMISLKYIPGGCIGPSVVEDVKGWFLDLKYSKDDILPKENVIADVHTEVYDEYNNYVGKVLHVATGNVNLGVFLTNAPLPDGRMMAFIGPVMSYYENITTDLKRFTDQEWNDSVLLNKVPQRPDWTSIYLANKNGELAPSGYELPSQNKAWNDYAIDALPIATIDNEILIVPNIVENNAQLKTSFSKETNINIDITDMRGVLVYSLHNQAMLAGSQTVQMPLSKLSKGIYFCKVSFNNTQKIVKLVKK